MRNAADCLAITAERVLKEYARIAFADIRKCVDWVGELVTEEEQPNGSDVLIIKHMVSNHVRLKSAAEIDDDIAAAIAEVRHSNAGGLSVKLYPKLTALDALADHLGIARPPRAEHPDQSENPNETLDPLSYEAARRIAFALERAQRSKETDDISDA
jgi:phage terminase small subunit